MIDIVLHDLKFSSDPPDRGGRWSDHPVEEVPFEDIHVLEMCSEVRETISIVAKLQKI
jgi:hypothetical protein